MYLKVPLDRLLESLVVADFVYQLVRRDYYECVFSEF